MSAAPQSAARTKGAGETPTRTCNDRPDRSSLQAKLNSKPACNSLSKIVKALSTTKGTTALFPLVTYTQPTDGAQRWTWWSCCGVVSAARLLTRSTREESVGARFRHRELSLNTPSDTRNFGRLKLWPNSDCRGTWEPKMQLQLPTLLRYSLPARISDFLTHPTSLGTHNDGGPLRGDPAWHILVRLPCVFTTAQTC
jgi:hypothetical protein